MTDELERWAAAQAPDVLQRAEQLAVSELARALMSAALASRAGTARPSRAVRSEPSKAVDPVQSRADASPAPTETGDALWVYCVTAADAAPPVGLPGVAETGQVERVDAAGLTALVSRVPLSEYGDSVLPGNLNDLAWLERVARAHERVLEVTMETAAIVPLRLCTIYRGPDRVRRMLEQQSASLTSALDTLAGHEEWSVKLLVDRALVEGAVARRSDEIGRVQAELEGTSGGGAYMLQRRLERTLREETDALIHELAEDVHARLQDWAADAVLNAPQNRDLSGHEGEMVLNGAYLIEAAKLDGLRELVGQLGERQRALGARLELSGPWPPYNFVPRAERASSE